MQCPLAVQSPMCPLSRSCHIFHHVNYFVTICSLVLIVILIVYKFYTIPSFIITNDVHSRGRSHKVGPPAKVGPCSFAVEIRIRQSVSSKMAEVMMRWCVDKVGHPGGPLCLHHAYLECMTPASLAFCRNIVYYD